MQGKDIRDAKGIKKEFQKEAKKKKQNAGKYAVTQLKGSGSAVGWPYIMH